MAEEKDPFEPDPRLEEALEWARSDRRQMTVDECIELAELGTPSHEARAVDGTPPACDGPRLTVKDIVAQRLKGKK